MIVSVHVGITITGHGEHIPSPQRLLHAYVVFEELDGEGLLQDGSVFRRVLPACKNTCENVGGGTGVGQF